MEPTAKNAAGLDEVKIHVKLKISALWVSVIAAKISR